MIGFKNFRMLLENRIEFLKNLHKEIDMSHDDLAQETIFRHEEAKDPTLEPMDDDVGHVNIHPHEIIDYLADHDPDPKKTHTQWMVGQYKKKNFRLEDGPRIKETLTHFSKPAIKARLAVKDINQYKSLHDLEDAIEPHLEAKSKGELEKQTKHEGADLIHTGSNGTTIHHLKTEAAACLYGKGTKWCTAGDKDNMFNSYNKRGPVFSVNTPYGEKYQIHNNSKQLMDAKNRPVKMFNLLDETQKDLASSEHPEIQAACVLHGNKYITSRHVDMAMKHPDPQIPAAALSSGLGSRIEPRHIDMAMQHPDPYVNHLAISKYGVRLEPRHIDMAMQHKNPEVPVEALLSLGNRIESRHIDMAMQHPSSHVAKIAILHQGQRMEPKHVDMAMQHQDAQIQRQALMTLGNKIEPRHIDMAMQHTSEYVSRVAMTHHRHLIEPRHIDLALQHNSSGVASKAFELLGRNIESRHIDMALQNPNAGVAAHVIRNLRDHLEPRHIDVALQHPDRRIAEDAFRDNKDKINSRHIELAMGRTDIRTPAMFAFRDHADKINSKHIEIALQHPDPSVREAARNFNLKGR